ncbi:Zn-dependent hydrolase [Amorphus orientalis]|uniref:N-carbamoyl-L-amino-acid hydrolase n=1 Tax=Amorphus orientalis TaxID=649198 RepID=A0AAE4AT05_9HYPH|nr:Zn-dependent hydrolase [Amorphus orientalis]MDQ0314519.1 N-carbamoyl-L-amino-acid hydrolase [Amorphus orientalis]
MSEFAGGTGDTDLEGELHVMGNLKIDADRLWGDLMETAAIGGTAKGGIRRLALSEEDRRVRDWFRTRCEALGCSVTVDGMGNMFAVRPGQDPELEPIAIGSHLDTQPTGGKFDGVLGVLAGLEILRTLEATEFRTRHPLVLVNWTNEEGARFSPAMLGSGVHAGKFDAAYAYGREDADGISVETALDAIGYRGGEPVGSMRFAAMFELHIEQGPILEDEERLIGIVEGVQGMRWFDVVVEGRESHAGSTPMETRRDALVVAADLIGRVTAIATAAGGKGTVGHLEVEPNSRNVVPGTVRMSVDLRHEDDAQLDAMTAALEQQIARLGEGPVSLSLTEIWRNPVVPFDADCVSAVAAAAEASGYPSRRLYSGAGHDAANVAAVAPTAMIFIPCREGLSHNEAESCTLEECAAGAQTLLDAVLIYDRRIEGAQPA